MAIAVLLLMVLTIGHREVSCSVLIAGSIVVGACFISTAILASPKK